MKEKKKGLFGLIFSNAVTLWMPEIYHVCLVIDPVDISKTRR